MTSEDSSDEEVVAIRRPRTFRNRVSYFSMQESYEFNERFRLQFEKFSYLLGRIEAHLEHPTQRSQALSPHQQLLIALHWLGTGVQYHSVGDMHGVSKATVCRVVHAVIEAINAEVVKELVCWPPDDVASIVDGFRNLAGMPLICGAADGTLVKIDAPTEFEPAYVDRHGNHSINALLVCCHKLRFLYVDSNWPGSTSDSRVLRNSGLYRKMESGWRPFPGTVLLGDSIYPLKSWLIPPIVQDINKPEQLRFARAHKKTRRVIECAIGILKEKFPCLNYLRLNPVFVCKVIKCCVALCNLSKFEDEDLRALARFSSETEDDTEETSDGEEEEAQTGQTKLDFFYRHFQN